MNIIDININDIKEYENNPRFNDNAVEAVANSIKEFGFKVPIILDNNNVIVAGHTRLKAAKQLEYEKVPCLVADDLTEEQVKAFRLTDNKVGELAEWDFAKLEEELMAIQDIDMSEFEFEINDICPDDFGTDFSLSDEDKKPIQTITFTLHDNQAELIVSCIDFVLTNNLITETFGNENKKGNALYEVVKEWAEQKKLK